MSDVPFNLRAIAVPAFGPSLLYGLSTGATLPVTALTARDLGASVAVSGMIAALMGIGSLVSNLPAAALAARVGERRAMMGAAVFGVLALLLCLAATHIAMLATGVFMVGMASAVFLLARQSYLTEAVPLPMRARAMSTLGGTTRIGFFMGPLLGAGFIQWLGLSGAYWVALLGMVGTGVIAYAYADFGTSGSSRSAPGQRGPSTVQLMRDHGRVLATLGLGVVLVSVLRASRQVVVPLWADHLGLEATVISLIYAFVAAIDMAVFYPAGKIMDERGRVWVAVPCVALMGAALMLIPLTSAPVAFVLVCLVLGFGNGIGSGIVMTLAADSAPVQGRTRFLGIWRLLSDIGSSGGPALLAGITALASLGPAIATIGALGWVAAALFWRHLPHDTPPR
ncbi:MFS transporter [Achromobacter sp. GG226]|uniref:MFS transporter n=1 Tax=Verticiella alkaliphila TaxID=2779529 RepID=UPI001C0BC8F0|nr:MFS transporter [Verticiella sp. GG226]MBU4610173.1 MFS transporter [Verticiella sp. GG226]